MADVFLGLGSNIDRERSLVAGLDALAELFSEIKHSSVYDSAAIGFKGSPFLNMVVQVSSDLGVERLSHKLRDIEFAHGRPLNATRNSSRQLDIDILLVDDLVSSESGVELPRGEILENAFVLWPLAEIAPGRVHPLVQKPYAQLWDEFSKQRQEIFRTSFSWRGRTISRASRG